MSDKGLTHRLNQRSRRAGLVIGISMLLTIAFCVAAFTVIYTALDGFTTDFVSNSGAATEQAQQAAAEAGLVPVLEEAQEQLGDAGEEADAAPAGGPAEQEPAPEPTTEPTPEPTGTPTDPNAFTPDYQINPGGSNLNLREGPGTATSIVQVLPPGTPLLFMNEEQTVQGALWMMFQTEDGAEGWVREVDVAPIDG